MKEFTISFFFIFSYLEIYNEKVKDLLDISAEDASNNKKSPLKVREHPKKGPYVQGEK